MGLDQYIYRAKKPKLENKVYTAEELANMNLHKAWAHEVIEDRDLIEQLLPYTQIIQAQSNFLNSKQIIVDYNLPENSYLGYIGPDGIQMYGKDENGNSVSQFITQDEVDKKYVLTETLPCYVWDTEEIQYWRKCYDIQDWIYEHIDGVQNTGYYMLDADLIREFNKEFDEDIPKEDPDEESALFYYEWY